MTLPRPRASVPLALLALTLAAGAQDSPDFRPPAVPLVTHDPYFSVWSVTDQLTQDWTRHWTGANHALCGLVRIDGVAYRIIGSAPDKVPALPQTGLHVRPTRTEYEFEGAGVRIALTFLSPVLAEDAELVARPASYITWAVRSLDKQTHDVALYFDCTAEWVVDRPHQKVWATRAKFPDLCVLRVGAQEQRLLDRPGDDLRIEWGFLYLACAKDVVTDDVIAGHDTARDRFVADGTLPDADDLRFPRRAEDDWPVLAMLLDLGSVGVKLATRHVVLAYDDLYSVEYLDRRLRPYWRRDGAQPADLLRSAWGDYERLVERCRRFDDELVADLTKVGGEPYARLAALAYRQCLAAHKLAADWDGRPLMFAKENLSNGCIATVDVIYPAAPLFLLLNPALLKAQLTPVLEYGSSRRWPHPFAPHDLGTYPLADGQVYGGSEKSAEGQMPVEESANMLLLVAALAEADGNAEYALRYWPTLTRWAEYLRDNGLDPANQLCTDDFADELAHNANLSLKAILALGAYARLCERAGKPDDARAYRRTAEQMAAEWPQRADDGDHYRLAFDKPDTWSQKYNLAWERVLRLGLFPPEVARREVAYYKTKLNQYGLPLDNRKDYTKLDWCLWTATLAETRADFEALVTPLYRWAH